MNNRTFRKDYVKLAGRTVKNYKTYLKPDWPEVVQEFSTKVSWSLLKLVKSRIIRKSWVIHATGYVKFLASPELIKIALQCAVIVVQKTLSNKD